MAERETATTTPSRQESRQGGRQEGRQESRLARREPSLWGEDPFGLLRRFTQEVDRVFDDFGFGRLASTFGRGRLTSPQGRGAESGLTVWNPAVDVFQRGNELVIRTDLPGLRKDDVKVEVTDESVVIQGDRRTEQEEERDGVYRLERSYGSFYREIPLPEGAITEQAKATFKDGVLEVVIPSPPEQANRGRRLEISEGAGSK